MSLKKLLNIVFIVKEPLGPKKPSLVVNSMCCFSTLSTHSFTAVWPTYFLSWAFPFNFLGLPFSLQILLWMR